MDKNSPSANELVISALEKHADTVRRVCFMYLKNRSDVEDIFQDVFLKLLQCGKEFESEEHEKAWLIRVTINKCKDFHKSFFRKNVCSLDEVDVIFEDKTENDVIRQVLSLPQKYRDVIYLYYYEGYSVPEISKILRSKENTIYSHLHRAKSLLKDKLER
jgi:RNA polymerase sigma factor (sigma-70 family)